MHITDLSTEICLLYNNNNNTLTYILIYKYILILVCNLPNEDTSNVFPL